MIHNTRSSSWTGRSARSLNEAFGPHQDFISDDAPMRKADTIIIGISGVAFMVVVALIAIEWIGVVG